MASGFKIADAYVEAHLDRDQLRNDIAGLPADIGSDVDKAGQDAGKRLGKGIGDGADGQSVGKRIADDVDKELGPRSDESGRDSGNKLSQGMQLALVRNSPLIAAAVGGALAFGAPVAIAGAGLLFGGIAAVAVHSNAEIKAAFDGLKSSVTSTFTDAAQVTVPLFVTAMGRIGVAVQALGPQLHTAFAALDGPIQSLTTGIISMANNAMPGLVAAARAASPVFEGLATLLGDIGTGLGQFFSVVSQHGSAAQQVFASLGSIIQSLLPTLGQLLGAGTELAAAVLPMLAAAMHDLLAVVNFLAPALPLLAAGFLSFKAITFINGLMDTFSTKLQTVAENGGKLTTALAGSGASAVSRFGGLLAPVAVALGLVSAASAEGDQKIRSWADALLQGGSAADRASAQMQHITDVTQAGLGGLHSWGDVWDRIKALTEGTTGATQKSTAAMREQLAAMDPITRAQALQKQALNDLNDALEKHGAGSASAESAERKYKDASDAATRAQSAEEQAIHGVTQAMLDQADEAMASIDSTFALQHAQNQQRDALAAVTQAIHDHGAASQVAHDAEQAYEESIYGTAQAAAQLAADQSGLKQGTEEYKNVLDTQLLKSLQAVEGTLTGPAKAAVDGFIKTLQDAGVTTDGVGTSADTTGQKLDALGNKNPKPTIGPAVDNVTPQVDNLMNSLFDLGTAHPVPKADLDINPATMSKAKADQMLAQLGGQRPTPQAGLDIGPAKGSKDVMVGMLAQLGGMRPTPTVGLNNAPFNSAAGGIYSQMAGISALRAFPWATLNASTAGAEAALNYAARNRTSTVYARVVSSGPAGFPTRPEATGGVMLPMASGGIVAMAAGADIFQPNNPTVLIGDNRRVRESFIPQDDSPRSKAILSETASAMGYGLVPVGGINPGTGTGVPNSGGGVTVHGGVTLSFPNVATIADPNLPRQLLVSIEQGLVKLQRERS